MQTVTKANLLAAAPLLRRGGVAVVPTDTLYGVVARAADVWACGKVHSLKGRSLRKTCIVLIADVEQIWGQRSKDAFVKATKLATDEPTSIIVPASAETPRWLIAPDNTIAYRLPRDEALLELLRETGPLIAPSANAEGMPPAMSIEEAKDYFHHEASIYVDAGRIETTTPSRIMRVRNDEVEYLR